MANEIAAANVKNSSSSERYAIRYYCELKQRPYRRAVDHSQRWEPRFDHCVPYNNERLPLEHRDIAGIVLS